MITSGRVNTEGDELYYEVWGDGRPLLMIPGGGGDSSMYSLVADILSDEYKVITYDRRANSRSTGNHPQNFDIDQQSRDAVAVLGAAGETSAFVFGNSSGAVIALDMAKTQSQATRAVVAHEPPTTRVHPRARQWQHFFASVYWTAFRFGTPLAMVRFVFGVGLPIRQMIASSSRISKTGRVNRPDLDPRPEETCEFFIKQELLPVTNYVPDIELINKNGVKVFMAAGKMSLRKKRFYAETAPILANLLDCEMVVFPGHHVSYLDMPQAWATVLRHILQRATG